MRLLSEVIFVAKLEMSKIEIVGVLSDSKSIVDMLQRDGSVQMISSKECEGVQFNEFSSTVSDLERFFSDAKTAIAVINKYSPEKKSLMSSLGGRKELTLGELIEKNERAEEGLSVAARIIELDKKIADSNAEIQRNIVALDVLAPWMSLDIPTDFHGTKTTAAFVGVLPGAFSKDDVLSMLKNANENLELCEAEIVSSCDGQTCLVVFCPARLRQEAESALRSLGFSYPSDPTKHPPKVRSERLKKRNEELELLIKDCKEELQGLASQRENLEFLCDYLSVRVEKYKALSMFGMTDYAFVISAYAATRDAKRLKEYIESRYKAYVEIYEPAPDEDVPVVLENNKFSKPVENVVKMYSLPSKTDIDPTSVTAFFYYFFFGMMLSDAGYGLMLVIAILIILKKFKLEESTRNTLRMYLYCGISTVFWGAMYGSWWGDLFSVINTEFLGGKPLSLVIWLDPLNELMRVMVWCFGFGLVHLFTGVAVKGYSLLKQGKKFDAFCETVPTYVLVLGAAPVFLSLFMTVPEELSKLSPYVIAVGAVLVILTAGREAKSIGGKLGKGFYGLYNMLSGYLGDVLSYSRLLALGLATGVIAQVMNMIGTIPENKVLKLIVFVIVAIFGHIANLAINIIGAYVHTTRLQYVEFYSKFYEGGGTEFKPLSLKTQYYRLKDDIAANNQVTTD